jgi:arginine:ornithine antiporter/lysine permease
MLFVFHLDRFDFDFWGNLTQFKLGSVGEQVKNSMLVTLWAFIGIEGAVVLSGRAASQKDVGRATVMGFLGCLIIYVLLSVLPYGFMTQAQLAGIANPSTAGVLEHVVGPWGAWLMNIGLIVAILSSWLSWTMITAQMPQSMAENGTFPKIFSRENSKGSPSISLWVTSLLMQLAMLLVYFSNNAWNTMLSITGVMVLPAYLMSCLYLWKITDEENITQTSRWSAKITGILGSVYAIWLIYAAGLKYMLMAVVFIALGLPIYLTVKGRDGQMGWSEKVLAILIVMLAVFAIYAFSRKIISV